MSLPRQLERASTTLANLLSDRYAPVQETLFGMLDVRDEAHLKGVSKEFRSSIMTWRNWDNILEKFFSDAKAFRSFQARCDGILAGNVVLDFFARTKKFIYDDPLLIFMVGQDDMEDASTFLRTEGYDRLSFHSDTYEKYAKFYSDEHGITQVFEHTNRSTRPDNRVKVLLCCEDDDTSLLTFFDGMDFESTLTLNFVTWNKAYSVFPYLTFVQKVGYLTGSCPENALDYDTAD
jgi:hypothetical protein